MPERPPSTKTSAAELSQPLINNLTVGDARHLLATEGGPLAMSQLVVRGISIVVVAAACAYAISAGHGW